MTNKYKNFNLIIFAVILIPTLILCSCKQNVSVPDNTLEINILCTGFSQYDWTKNITNTVDAVNVEMLQKHSVDVHNYQPSADDIIRISNCDIIICTGGEADKPIFDILDSLGDKKPIVINMMEELEQQLINVAENDSSHQHTEHNFSYYDEHIWLSLKNADILCKIISDKVVSIDPDNIKTYKLNTDAYLSKLSDLDKKYEYMVNKSTRREIVFADRYPFAYLARDYGLVCYCAFPGCSAETDASFETILSLASKIDELDLTSVMTIDGGILSIDEAVISSSEKKGIKTLSLNSLQSVSYDEITEGLSYLSTMEENFEIIKESLN